MWSTTLATASTNESLLPFRPSNVPSWDVPIMRAAALVNPEITGMLTNSTRNPRCSSPMNVITQPVRKQRSTWESKAIYIFVFQNFFFVYLFFFFLFVCFNVWLNAFTRIVLGRLFLRKILRDNKVSNLCYGRDSYSISIESFWISTLSRLIRRSSSEKLPRLLNRWQSKRGRSRAGKNFVT